MFIKFLLETITCARPRLVVGALQSSLAIALSHDFRRCSDLNIFEDKEREFQKVLSHHFTLFFIGKYFIIVNNMSGMWQQKSHNQKSNFNSNCFFSNRGNKMGGNTHIQVEVFRSAHSFRWCQNPWQICQENNHESAPKERQIQKSKKCFLFRKIKLRKNWSFSFPLTWLNVGFRLHLYIGVFFFSTLFSPNISQTLT